MAWKGGRPGGPTRPPGPRPLGIRGGGEGEKGSEAKKRRVAASRQRREVAGSASNKCPAVLVLVEISGLIRARHRNEELQC